VKQLLNEVPQKPKNLKESWSSIIKKEVPISMTTKSATFKKPKPCEAANKAKSSITLAEEPRVANQLMSQNVTNDQSSSILGSPSTTASMVAPVISKTDATSQPVATGNSITDSNNIYMVVKVIYIDKFPYPLLSHASHHFLMCHTLFIFLIGLNLL